MKRHTCPSCGIHISATDRKTLAWGVRTHVCREQTPTADDADPLQSLLLCWLAGAYGRPFWLVRPGVGAVMVGG